MIKGIRGLWQRIKQEYKKRNISEQIFYAMLLVTGAVTLLLCVICYVITSRTLEKEYRTSHQYNLEVTNKVMQIQVEYAIEQARDLLGDDAFMRIMKEERSKKRYFSGQNFTQISRILTAVTTSSNFIQEIVAVNENGNVIYITKYSNTSGDFSHYYLKDNILEEAWIDTAREAKGKEVFFGMNLLIPDERTFSVVKNMIDTKTGESVGFIIMNLNKNFINHAFADESRDYDTYRYMLVDLHTEKYGGEANIVYCNAAQNEQEEILKDYLGGTENRKYIFNEKSNTTTGWQLVSVIERGELAEGSRYVALVIIICLVLIGMLYIFLSRIISRAISLPLQQLEENIQLVAEGNRRVTTWFDDSEVGKIGQQFKHLVNHNLDLHDKLLKTQLNEREAELLLLQSQINPHFLYNTLDSIYMQAIINDDDEVANMVQLLSEIFHLSLNKGKKLTTVRDAVEHINSYMKIQGIRFYDRFALHMDVEERILDEKILTFLLQPIVENAFYHGLEPKVGKGNIWVKGWEEQEQLHFLIRDDGVGIEDLSVVEKGYGIANITERIKIYYGEAYGLTFESTPGQGTQVEMVLPKVKEEKDDVSGGSN